MSIRREPSEEEYDVIIVGSGVGGLSAAALLAAKTDRKVLVIERHDRPGGYAHSFYRNRYHFDAAIHVTAGCGQMEGDYNYGTPTAATASTFATIPTNTRRKGLIELLFRTLDIHGMCNFLKVDPFYSTIFPGFRLDAPSTKDKFIDTHVQHFPKEKDGLNELIRLCSQISHESAEIPTNLSFIDVIRFPSRFPTISRYHKATLQDVLDKYLQDDRIKAVFSTLWPYLGLPPSRLSFLYWSNMLMSFLEEGVFYCQGTFQNLANALVEAFTKKKGRGRGEILLQSRVRRIVVKENRVAGVVLENGSKVKAPIVISNADATQTFEELIGVDKLPKRYLDNLRRMKPSLSAFVVYLATDMDLNQIGGRHEIFLNKSWNHDEAYDDIYNGKPSGIGITVPTLTDPSLAPAGQHLVIATTLIPYDIGVSWRTQKAEYVKSLMSDLEKVFPGLQKRITYAEGATPRTMERYTLNLTGAIYGWEVSPHQVGRGRLAHKTPIHGLYLSGHWTRPGGGIYGVIVSGLETAAIISGHRDAKEFLQTLTV